MKKNKGNAEDNQLVLFKDILETPVNLKSLTESRTKSLITAKYSFSALQEDLFSFINTKFLEQAENEGGVIPLEKYVVTFSLRDLEGALGTKKGGTNWQSFTEAAKNMVETHIEMWSMDEKRYIKSPIYSLLVIDENKKVIQMALNPMLFKSKPFVEGYTKLLLEERGQMKSFYSKRLFAYLKSFSGLAGKNGNVAGCWFCDVDINEFGSMCGEKVSNKEEQTRVHENYKRYIKRALSEIKESGKTMTITGYTPNRSGRTITGYRISCKLRGIEYLISLLTGEKDGCEKCVDKEDPRLKKIYLNKEKFLSVFSNVLQSNGLSYSKVEEYSNVCLQKYLLDALYLFDKEAL